MLPRSGAALCAQEQTATGHEKTPPPKDLGMYQVPRPEGGNDRIYYSVVTPEEEAKQKNEEKEKLDKSLDVLRNIIIDGRR